MIKFLKFFSKVIFEFVLKLKSCIQTEETEQEPNMRNLKIMWIKKKTGLQ